MKIIALSCTQKRLPSVTDALLEAAVTGLVQEAKDAVIQPIRLIDHRIEMCEAEDTCLDPSVGRCTLEDDFQRVVDLAEGADAMLLAMPVYGGNVPAVLKIFQERLKSFMNAANRPFGNMTVATIVHSRTMLTEPALAALFPWYLRLKNKNVASVCVSQNDHQELAGTAAHDLCVALGRQLGMSLEAKSSPAPSRTVLPLLQSPPRPRCGDPVASRPGA
ncbi:flavodoxin family protein [Streptomyces hundungensis]|uniref:flavodoxin family protein n=1 Tax=Streptomyces hundungensis TaxID=1077946 RepID=UPI0033D0C87A